MIRIIGERPRPGLRNRERYLQAHQPETIIETNNRRNLNRCMQKSQYFQRKKFAFSKRLTRLLIKEVGPCVGADQKGSA